MDMTALSSLAKDKVSVAGKAPVYTYLQKKKHFYTKIFKKRYRDSYWMTLNDYIKIFHWPKDDLLQNDLNVSGLESREEYLPLSVGGVGWAACQDCPVDGELGAVGGADGEIGEEAIVQGIFQGEPVYDGCHCVGYLKKMEMLLNWK